MHNKKTIYFLIFLIINFIFYLPIYSQEVNSEIISIESLDKLLKIKVSKSYPQVKFSIYKSDKKILIELLDTKYNPQFKFDVPTKIKIINGLGFPSDISIGEARIDVDKFKVGIWINLKEDLNLTPKVLSMEDGIVVISFPEKNLDLENKIQEQDRKIIEPDKKINIDDSMTENSSLVSENVIQIYNEATDEYTSGNLENAEVLYSKVLELDPNFFLAKFNLANIYIEEKKHDLANPLLTELVEKFEYFRSADEKNLLIVKNSLGISYFTNGDYDKALEQFEGIIKINPNVHEPYYNIGLIYEKQEKINEAIDYFKKTIEHKSDFADGYYHLGMLSLMSKNKKEAIKYFSKVIELDNFGKLGRLSQKELEKIDKKFKR